MTILSNKVGVIFGFATTKSLAWGVAKVTRYDSVFNGGILLSNDPPLIKFNGM